jgi:hypothetical protein
MLVTLASVKAPIATLRNAATTCCPVPVRICVADGEFVEAGRDRAVLLQPADAAFDRVALSVLLSVEVVGPAALRAPAGAVGGLVGRDRDHAGDPAAAQVSAVPATGVGLVRHDRVRPGPDPAGELDDIAGAHAAGMRTAFVARAGRRTLPHWPAPDATGADLTEATSTLLISN